MFVPFQLQQPSWDHDSEDGILNSSMIKRSEIDGASLSRRSVLPNDNDTRDLGELILALKGKKLLGSKYNGCNFTYW